MDLDKVRCPFLYVYGIMNASELGRAKLSHNERRNATTSFACGIIFKDRYIKEVL